MLSLKFLPLLSLLQSRLDLHPSLPFLKPQDELYPLVKANPFIFASDLSFILLPMSLFSFVFSTYVYIPVTYKQGHVSQIPGHPSPPLPPPSQKERTSSW